MAVGVSECQEEEGITLLLLKWVIFLGGGGGGVFPQSYGRELGLYEGSRLRFNRNCGIRRGGEVY